MNGENATPPRSGPSVRREPATVAVAGRIVTPSGVIPHGLITIDGQEIRSVGPHPDRPRAPAPTGWVVPGFVDMHVHGGGGHSLTDGDADAARAAAAFHLGHGTTTMVASLVTAPLHVMARAAASCAPLVDDGVLAGVHLEGPYLSPRRCGAHNPAWLRSPSVPEAQTLLDAAAGTVRMVTLAPELPAALTLIEALVARSVVAAVGHTDANYRQTRAAIDAGASVATHLFNACRPVHHREPGPVPALLAAPGVTCELIVDGVHLHEAAVALAASVAGAHRVALVTDAIAAAGAADGRYQLAGRPVDVVGGVARLAPPEGAGEGNGDRAVAALVAGAAAGGTIAGSTLTMDTALRRSVRVGLSIPDAVRAAATNPAAALGLAGVGALVPGYRADLVVLDDDLMVRRVMRRGRWLRDVRQGAADDVPV